MYFCKVFFFLIFISGVIHICSCSKSDKVNPTNNKNPDATQPAAALSSATPNPTSEQPLLITITFSEEIIGLTIDDISISEATGDNLTAINETEYTIDVYPTSDLSLIIISLAEDKVQDLSGNGNIASNQLSITYDYCLNNNDDPDCKWYLDADSDGYGSGAAVLSVYQLEGYVANNTDCNDADDSIHPAATEICDLIDQDCNDVELENCTHTWTEHHDNPIISFNKSTSPNNWSTSDIVWNDASIIKEDGIYNMWFTGGKAFGINFVKVYKSTSINGIEWSEPVEVFAPPFENPVIWVEAPAEFYHGAYILINESIPVFKKAEPSNSKDWYVFKHMNGQGEQDYYLSGIPEDTIPDIDLAGYHVEYLFETVFFHETYDTGNVIDTFKCSDDDVGNYPNCPLGIYADVENPSKLHVIYIAGLHDTFNNEATETPSVIKVGSTYHMYYSSFKIGNASGRYEIGHATSNDGTNWTGDENPVITYHGNSDFWGFYVAAEPGAVYNPIDERIYLYYTTVSSRTTPFEYGILGSMQGIAVAVSENGTDFTKTDGVTPITGEVDHQLVLSQSDSYLVDDFYIGYSTPYALIDSKGVSHLFYDAVQYPGPDPDNSAWTQVAIAHAVSSDGIDFTEVESDIFVFDQGDWKNGEVLSPCVLEESDGCFKMWFAGGTGFTYPLTEGFYGIGYATTESCP